MHKESSHIIFEKVSFGYKGAKLIFNELTLALETSDKKSKVVAIMGSSGIGKSTLFKLILGIEKPSAGKIEVSEELNISYMPQSPVLFDHLSIHQNAAYLKNISYYKSRFDERVFQQFAKQLGLKKVLVSKENINELSGGQKQRIALLRALSVKPDVLMLDEPCNGLDIEVKMNFLNTLKLICQEQNILVLYISHHIDEANMIADDILYLYDNKDHTATSYSSIDEFHHDPPTSAAFNQLYFPKALLINEVNSENNIANIVYNSITISEEKSPESKEVEFLYNSFENSYFLTKNNVLFSVDKCDFENKTYYATFKNIKNKFNI